MKNLVVVLVVSLSLATLGDGEWTKNLIIIYSKFRIK
jgi:hypothetical protein